MIALVDMFRRYSDIGRLTSILQPVTTLPNNKVQNVIALEKFFITPRELSLTKILTFINELNFSMIRVVLSEEQSSQMTISVGGTVCRASDSSCCAMCFS